MLLIVCNGGQTQISEFEENFLDRLVHIITIDQHYLRTESAANYIDSHFLNYLIETLMLLVNQELSPSEPVRPAHQSNEQPGNTLI